MFKTLELPAGFAPLAPLPGLCTGPTGGLKRPLDPSPNNFAPPISNSWLRPCISVSESSGIGVNKTKGKQVSKKTHILNQ